MFFEGGFLEFFFLGIAVFLVGSGFSDTELFFLRLVFLFCIAY